MYVKVPTQGEKTQFAFRTWQTYCSDLDSHNVCHALSAVHSGETWSVILDPSPLSLSLVSFLL